MMNDLARAMRRWTEKMNCCFQVDNDENSPRLTYWWYVVPCIHGVDVVDGGCDFATWVRLENGIDLEQFERNRMTEHKPYR